MRKAILPFWVLLASLLPPVASDASYIIHLKNGGRFLTPQYWEEDHYVKFYIVGGVMGIEKKTVRKIEKSDVDVSEVFKVKAPEKLPAETEQKAEKNLSPQGPPGKIDFKAYQDKMAKLKSDLNKTLTRIREATQNKDLGAKDEATADNRKISAEMYRLTDELKEKNNGILPAGWWEGTGREEPAIP
jgi:hypothetical protein